MNTTHVKSFLYAAKYGNISKAAVQLNYSTSTIYEHLKSLEKEVGAKLYDRTSAGICLTEDGEIFLEYANRILAVMDDIERQFHGLRDTIRITASESSDFFVMRPLIKKFMSQYPNIEVEYYKAITDIAMERLVTNQCDISIIAEPEFSTTKVKCDFLCKLPLSFVASPNHVCFHNGLVASLEQNVLLSTMGFPMISALLMSSGFLVSNCFAKWRNIGDLETVRDLAYSGQGVALLPSHMVAKDLEEKRLRIVPELDRGFFSRVYMLTPLGDAGQKNSIRDFVALSHSLFSRLPQ